MVIVRKCERCRVSHVVDPNAPVDEKNVYLCPKCREEWDTFRKCRKVVTEYDAINRPKHYVDGRKYEPVDVAEDWGLDKDAYLFNAFKYIARAGRKDDIVQDLEKAVWYLRRRIDRTKRNSE